MISACLYFRVHQPYRLKKYQSKDISISGSYEDAFADEENINRVANNCYLPANNILYEQIIKQQGKFKVSFSVSGTLLELLIKYRPDIIQSFKKLAATGCVEFLAETYYHSLSSLHSKEEFQRQVVKHAELVNRLFGVFPKIFRNTELIHNNRIASLVCDMGLSGILCEGIERILQGRTANQLYTSPGNNDLVLLLRNPVLSDDIEFRFDDPNWTEHPLTADKFANWLFSHPHNTEVINLFMDYETFGIHKKAGSGIFDFLSSLPDAVLIKDGLQFLMPSEVVAEQVPKDSYDATRTISWEDNSDASCVWCENVMQNNTLKKIYSLESMVRHSDEKAKDIWGRLQSADHFYYMAEKKDKEGAVKYLNPFTTAIEAFHNYNNIVADFEISLIRKELQGYKRFSSRKFSNTLF